MAYFRRVPGEPREIRSGLLLLTISHSGPSYLSLRVFAWKVIPRPLTASSIRR